MKKITYKIVYILILAIGCLLFWAVFALVWDVSKRGYPIQESEMWIAWIVIVGIASLAVFLGYHIYSMISK